MKLDPRISVITLGVDDLDRAAAFYEALGWSGTRNSPKASPSSRWAA